MTLRKLIVPGVVSVITILSAATLLFFASAPTQADSKIVTSLKDGDWSDPNVWNSNQVPTGPETVVIDSNHTVTYNLDESTVSGIEIKPGATLKFDPSMNTVLQTDENVLVQGKLVMKSTDPQYEQTLRFINVDEKAFVGGGMEPVASDVGLWVTGSGQLDIEGADKSAWTRLVNGIAEGDAIITVKDASNWQVGDEISIVPTEAPTVGSRSHTGFHLTTIAAISGNTITLAEPTTHAHPQVNDTWTAEVLNLTRNVRIEGTGNGESSNADNGRAHIFINSMQPQHIKYLGIQHMGPRQGSGSFTRGNEIYEPVTGRYSLHFHHSMDGSRGSMIEGVVARNNGGHAFVPHASHGITMRDSIAYEGWEHAFWWDSSKNAPENDTHDLLWERNVAAILRSDPSFRGYRLTGFALPSGENIEVRDSVAVGIQGNRNASGFTWGESGSGVWKFDTGNIAHNNKVDGIFTWQNNGTNHTIDNFVAYYNGKAGIDHGAYANGFQYRNSILYGNAKTGILVHGLSKPDKEARFEDIVIDGAGITENGITQGAGAIDSKGRPITFRNIQVDNIVEHAVKVHGTKQQIIMHFVNSSLSGNQFYIENGVKENTTVRVQPENGQPFALRRSDQEGELINEWNARKTDIEQFAPNTIGTGDGLKVEFFNDTSFTDLKTTTVDGDINSSWWNYVAPYHTITVPNYSIRWTGQIEPVYSGPHTFHMGIGGKSGRLWIDGEEIIAEGGYPKSYSSEPIMLEAGKKYDIKVEFYDEKGFRAKLGLSWEHPSMIKEIVPQRQLYSLLATDEPGSTTPAETPSNSEDSNTEDTVTEETPAADEEVTPEPEATPEPEPSVSATSLKDGDWSDPTVWSNNQVPSDSQTVIIDTGHTITYDLAESTVSGLEIKDGAALQFHPSMTTLLQTKENVLIDGKLIMNTTDPEIEQTLRRVNN